MKQFILTVMTIVLYSTMIITLISLCLVMLFDIDAILLLLIISGSTYLSCWLILAVAHRHELKQAVKEWLYGSDKQTD